MGVADAWASRRRRRTFLLAERAVLAVDGYFVDPRDSGEESDYFTPFTFMYPSGVSKLRVPWQGVPQRVSERPHPIDESPTGAACGGSAPTLRRRAKEGVGMRGSTFTHEDQGRALAARHRGLVLPMQCADVAVPQSRVVTLRRLSRSLCPRCKHTACAHILILLVLALATSTQHMACFQE
ncbi:unnamed protein product, partial [Prorocentrum cordatum]